ncbi:MAG TPA: penicillin acylase family protein [candidate division Zixibacteria bacterium]|nr:penicillin acylase family protein [candidate division Zixibacteria bacterium]
MRRRIRAVVLILAVLLLIVVLAAGGWAVLTVRASFPQTSGTLRLPGLADRVEVRRDAWGIPNISARAAEDLFMAQGFVHAQDRFWEMDFRRHVTAGRLSELFGSSQVATDAFIRALGWRRVAEAELDLLAPDTVRYLEAYAAGVNAYLAQRSGAELSLEYAVLGLQNPGYQPEPWTPADSVAWLKAMAWDLRNNFAEEAERVLLASRLSDDQVEQLFPPYPYERHPVIVTDESDMRERIQGAAPASPNPDAVDVRAVAQRVASVQALAARVPELLGTGSGVGSNAFAVDGSRTTTGGPLLANDPHLAPSMPGIWHQVGLHCRPLTDACPFDVTGFSFSGLPGVVIGHNRRIAWGFTNLGTDVTDFYLEDVQGGRYRYDGRWWPLEERVETIRVAGGDPVTITVRATRHGPLLSDVSDQMAQLGAIAPLPPGVATPMSRAAPDVSLAWTALQPSRTADAIFMLNEAADFDAFRAVAAHFDVPAQNMVYADVEGHIGYQAPGKVPIRGAGDGRWPVPGWDPSYDWQGFHAAEALPWMLDPAEGYVVTANNAVLREPASLHLTDDWDRGYRAARIVQLLQAAGPLDVEGMLQVTFDQHGPLADFLLPALNDLRTDAALSEEVREALAALDGWDGMQGPDSAPAALVNAVWRHLLARTFDDELGFLPEDMRPNGADRWMEVMRSLLDDPDAAWWDDATTGDVVEDRDTVLRLSVDEAVAELRSVLGDDPGSWRWGRLHRLELRNATFGESGIGPIEWLFNRGPWEAGGGEDVVNATGWTAPLGYAVDWVPSMRMVVDLSDLDASRYINLTGVSGHAFGPHYDDQTDLWARGETIPWPFSEAAVEAATEDLLILEP